MPKQIDRNDNRVFLGGVLEEDETVLGMGRDVCTSGKNTGLIDG